jgi:predicted O-linked N-acetylglucosamine transferase (SPINDLY family)
MVARQGALVNELVGLNDLVAHSFTGYEDIAVELAGDLERLKRLRAQLRQNISASPLSDASAFARVFTDALEGMWSAREINL